MIILNNQYGYCLEAHPAKRRLADVHVSAEQRLQATICMLRPLHTPVGDLTWAPLAAQQLAHHMRIKWPCMKNLQLKGHTI